MMDSATIEEAIDLLRCAGWMGYAKAIEDRIKLLMTENEELRSALHQALAQASMAEQLARESEQAYYDGRLTHD